MFSQEQILLWNVIRLNKKTQKHPGLNLKLAVGTAVKATLRLCCYLQKIICKIEAHCKN